GIESMMRCTHSRRARCGGDGCRRPPQRGARLLVLAVFAAAALLTEDALLAQPETAEAVLAAERALLEERGATIGRVNITVENVFDPNNPDEDKPLYRWANRVHVRTRESVIESILLFRPGDRFEAR